MTTHDDIRAIASTLHGAIEGTDRFSFGIEVKGKLNGFVWSWAEKVNPKKARVVSDRVLAILVPDLTAKDLILASDPDRFLTEPHYNGYPAVLVRLDTITPEELEELMIEAWRCRAPLELLAQFDAQ